MHLIPNQKLHDFRGFNIGPGAMAPVLMADKQFHLMRFGLTPFWSKKPLLLFNARSEGDFNKENDRDYTGNKGIFQKPSFRAPIRSKRCVVFVNGFLEGPEKEKLSKPYYVYDESRDFMPLAAVFDQWVNPETAEEITGFAIITSPSTKVTAAIGHHRSPIILQDKQIGTWLKADHLDQISPLLEPYPVDTLNAFEVSSSIKSPQAQDPELLEPIGPPILKRYGVRFHTEFDTQGFGRKKKL